MLLTGGERPGQELARLRARPQGVLRKHVCSLHPCPRLFADLAIADADVCRVRSAVANDRCLRSAVVRCVVFARLSPKAATVVGS
jgi:hypothetical protein